MMEEELKKNVTDVKRAQKTVKVPITKVEVPLTKAPIHRDPIEPGDWCGNSPRPITVPEQNEPIIPKPGIDPKARATKKKRGIVE